MPNTATRLISLLMLLQRQPNQKAADLARELGISVRSLHRYVGMLEEMGIPIYSERGPYGGFSLVRGYKMPPLVFTPEEAVALYLGTGLVREVWGPLYQDAAQAALAKLDNVLPDGQRAEVAWAARSLVTAGLRRPNLGAYAAVLETIRGAIRERRRVRFTYLGNARPQAEEREVDTYALVCRWDWWYVVGHCHLRRALRMFRLDRMNALEVLAQGFEGPTNFDVRAFLASEQQALTPVRVRLSFVPEAAHVVYSNRAAWDSLEDQPDGTVLVTLSVPEMYWAASIVMGYGPIVTVIEPLELRAMVAEWARATAAQYEGEPKP